MTRSVLGLLIFALLVTFQADPAFAARKHHATVTAHAKQPLTVHGGTLEMQKRLANLGHYTGPLDGVYGPLTKQALIDFQREKGLYISGSPTKQTLAALREMPMASSGKGAKATPIAAIMQRQPFGLPIAYFGTPWTTKPEWLPKQ